MIRPRKQAVKSAHRRIFIDSCKVASTQFNEAAAMPKSWYSIKAKAEQSAEIAIYDDIGAWGVTAKQFIGDLKAISAKSIKLSISSYGGSVFDALAMYNALRQHDADIEVVVMGVAASAASLVAMAGDKIVMPENAFMMVHNPLNFAYGNAEDLREMADVLDKIGASLIATYVARTGLPEEEVKALLDAETWLNAEEAVAKGFADELQPALKIAASADMDRLPENVRASIADAQNQDDQGDDGDDEQGNEGQGADHQEADPAPAARTLAALIIAQASKAGIAAHADALLLDAAIQTAADVEAAIAEAGEIASVCAAAKLPDMAGKLIKARVPLASVRARLIEAKAALDAALPVNHRIPPGNPAGKPSDVWAKILPNRQTKE